MKNIYKTLASATLAVGLYGCAGSTPKSMTQPTLMIKKELTHADIMSMPLSEVLEKVAKEVRPTKKGSTDLWNQPAWRSVGTDDYLMAISDNKHAYACMLITGFQDKDTFVYLLSSEEGEANLFFMDKKPFGSLEGVAYVFKDSGKRGEFNKDKSTSMQQHLFDNILNPQYDSLARLSLMHLNGIEDKRLEDTIVVNQKSLSGSSWLTEHDKKSD